MIKTQKELAQLIAHACEYEPMDIAKISLYMLDQVVNNLEQNKELAKLSWLENKLETLVNKIKESTK